MSDLVVGWQVTPTLEPKYWLNHPDAKPGLQSVGDLFTIPADSMATHTAIIAQSGSGKSFFLGRLVEELMLRTSARCLILDPNSDFLKINQIEDAKLWDAARYENRVRSGKLPHEKAQDQFATGWEALSIAIRGGGRSGEKKNPRYRPLRLHWPSVSIEFLGEDIGPLQRSELYHCHAFVKTVNDLMAIQNLGDKKEAKYLTKAESLLKQADQPEFSDTIKSEFDVGALATRASGHHFFLRVERKSDNIKVLEGLITEAITAARYISPEVKRFYFGKLNEFRATGIIEELPQRRPDESIKPCRLEVIDLPSLPNPSTRLLAVNAVVATEWERARNSWTAALSRPEGEDARVPTFVIVDEAHNVVPGDPRSKAEHALREQFRTIVAEGRKYGLFLVLVSQRPEKLDPLVVSECENRAVMRLSSGSALEAARTRLSLEDLPPKLLTKCLELERGRVLLTGPWSPEGPEIFYCAARRTREGGRSLNKKWTSAPSQEDGASATSGAAKGESRPSEKGKAADVKKSSKSDGDDVASDPI